MTACGSRLQDLDIGAVIFGKVPEGVVVILCLRAYVRCVCAIC